MAKISGKNVTWKRKRKVGGAKIRKSTKISGENVPGKRDLKDGPQCWASLCIARADWGRQKWIKFSIIHP